MPDGVTTIQFSRLGKNELVHNVGADFDATGTANVPVYLFPSDSAVAQRILLSDDFYTAVTNTMTANAAEVKGYFAKPDSANSRDFTWPMIGNDSADPTNLLFPNNRDLFLSFGTTQPIIATMTVTVARDDAGVLHAIAVNIAGVMTDTYAWDFDRGGLDADGRLHRSAAPGNRVSRLRYQDGNADPDRRRHDDDD